MMANALYGAAAPNSEASADRQRLGAAMKDHEPDATTKHFRNLSDEKKNDVYSLSYM